MTDSEMSQNALIAALKRLIERGDRIEAVHLDEIAREIGHRDATRIAEQFSPEVQAQALIGFAIEAADKASRLSGNEAIAEATKAKALGRVIKHRISGSTF